jgi:hypothetical protein
VFLENCCHSCVYKNHQFICVCTCGHYNFFIEYQWKVLAMETVKTNTLKLSLYQSSLQSVLEILYICISRKHCFISWHWNTSIGIAIHWWRVFSIAIRINIHVLNKSPYQLKIARSMCGEWSSVYFSTQRSLAAHGPRNTHRYTEIVNLKHITYMTWTL